MQDYTAVLTFPIESAAVIRETRPRAGRAGEPHPLGELAIPVGIYFGSSGVALPNFQLRTTHPCHFSADRLELGFL